MGSPHVFEGFMIFVFKGLPKPRDEQLRQKYGEPCAFQNLELYSREPSFICQMSHSAAPALD